LTKIIVYEDCPYAWKPYTEPAGPLIDGLTIGQTAEGREVYVSRAYVGVQLAPGSLLIEDSGSRVAGFYTEYDGTERFIPSNIEYFATSECPCDYKWISSEGGAIIMNAIQFPSISDGFTFYVGRILYEGSWYVGKVTLETKTMYYGNGLNSDSYEVLICEPKQ
jgi:hypothetical protein